MPGAVAVPTLPTVVVAVLLLGPVSVLGVMPDSAFEVVSRLAVVPLGVA
jgi:hypothetical protein